MPTSYTPDAEYGSDPAIHADGDAGSAANFNGPLEELLNRSAYARAATDGLLVWNRSARCTGGGTNNGNFGVYVPPIEAVSLYDGASWLAFGSGSETQLTSSGHFASNTLANSTWYYVYAKVTTGALAFEVSVTVPDATLTWKDAAPNTHRYLFCFRTNASGVPLAFRMAGGRYLWRQSAIAGADLDTLGLAAATSFTDVTVLAMPPHARLALLHWVFTADGGGNRIANLRTNGDTSDNWALHAGAGTVASGDIEIETDSSQVVEYQVSNASASFNLWTMGFRE